MVDLPTVGNGIVTSVAPTSAITSGVIEKTANDRANAYGKVANAMMDVSTDLAKQQAANDLIDQKITRNADGSVNVESPASAPLIFGDAGKAYMDAVKVGTVAQHDNDISQHFAELHTQFPTDPAAFKTAAESYLSKRGQQVTGPMGEAVQAQGQQLLTQHFNAITSTAASNDIANQKKSLTSQIEDQKNTAIALARQNGTDSPEFKQAVEKMNLSYDALGTNPLFKMPLDQIDREKKNTAALLQGEALVAHVDATFTKRGKGDAQKELQSLLENPNLRETDRSRLYTQGLARLGYLTADAKEQITANRQITTGMETGLANRTIKPEDPAVGQAIKRAQEIGDTEGAQRITAAAAMAQHLRGVNTLPTELKSEVLGVTPLTQVKTSAGKTVTVSRTAASAFQGFLTDLEATGYKIDRVEGYNDRNIAGTNVKSKHAGGNAIDINPDRNPDTGPGGKLVTDLPPNVGAIAAKWGLKWGGDFVSKKDAMHFELADQQPGQTPRVVAPSANGRSGFTDDQVKQNPFLLSAYVRTLAADPELRVQSAKQTAAAVGKALDNGILPSPSAVAEVNQAAQMFPEKMGSVADEMNGRLKGQQIAQVPQEHQDQIVEAYKRATDGQDVHHMNIAAAALKQVQDSNKNMQEHPYDEAALRGWTQPAAPIDPANPATIAPAIVQRAALSARIGELNHTPAPPLLDKDEMPKLQAALQGPQGPAVLANIADALKPEEMNTLLKDKGFVDSVTGMMSSKDPGRMMSAMTVVDRMWRNNAADAEAKFGAAAVTRLQAWQGLKDSFSPVELAERLNASDDPSTLKARTDAKEAAETETKSLTPGDMAYKLGTSFGIPILSRIANQITGATPNVPFDSIKGGELVADYRTTYAALRSYGVDADKASDLAVKRLSGTWGVSAAAGNQVMKNAPERFYPAIEGSRDWIGDDLKKWITGKAGTEFSGDDHGIHSDVIMAGLERNWSLQGLIADGQTQAEIAAGRPPSYQVAIKRKDGTLDIIPSRIAFDPTSHIAAHEMNLRDQQSAVDYQRSGQFQNAMPQP